ncbi:hypothetical protein [Sphaerisporangium rhizosphaerae]|uniref:Uncharacterized protein n=1 Tax=Sphaerisporangium rhizosphaerae TaxID=2269375 RepID=A0ABW2P6G6_9ACTN
MLDVDRPTISPRHGEDDLTTSRLVRTATAIVAVAACAASGCSLTRNELVPADSQPIPQRASDEPDDADDADDVDDKVEGFIEVCVTRKTRTRVNYRGCDDARPAVTWYYLPLSAKVPAVGSTAKRGTFKRPKADLYRAPAKGGLGTKVMIADVEDRVEICVLRSSRIRFSEIRCDDGEKGYGWYYIRIDGHVPPVGKKAEDGSFRKPYGDTYRARRKGGDAAKAAIDYEDPDAVETDDGEEEEENCTYTINGQCVATNKCTAMINNVCADGDGSGSSTTESCHSVYMHKRWIRRCS